MLKTFTNAVRRVADTSERIALWLEKKSIPPTDSKFVTLAPTDNADGIEVYSEAIEYALSQPNVTNIALTGPYGSGKSSIIQTYLKKHKVRALQISLATFIAEKDINVENDFAEENDPKHKKVDTEIDTKEINRHEIERSILQQMLYGADANNLPLSRFKRIQSPDSFSKLKTLYITLGLIVLGVGFSKRDYILNENFIESLETIKYPYLFIFGISAVFLWQIIHHFYTASFGLSLKSLSLTDIEIKPANDDQASILNRHFDEIIYFFQQTKYDLVIIEDLDRFNNSEIFTSLREINKQVNENAGIGRDIKFLYALRDDMFENTERTKFFEFIIPVIPIVNTSNSVDIILKHIDRLNIKNIIDEQFIREVSIYISDIRLIQNIFNEFLVYYKKINTDQNLVHNPNKLLSVLIYKNVFPRDFEQLHKGKGIFYKIIEERKKIIKDLEVFNNKLMNSYYVELEELESQIPNDLAELKKIFSFDFISFLPSNISKIKSPDGGLIEIKMISDIEKFEQLLTTNHIEGRNIGGQSQVVNIASNLKSSELHKKFISRKDRMITSKSISKKNILNNIEKTKNKISHLRLSKLNELIQSKSDLEIFNDFGEHVDLAKYLILEGYLDENYYQYTSLFHTGRLSPRDYKFLIYIRSYTTPEPQYEIDNPIEIIASMRDEDFQQSFVLNVSIIDKIFSKPNIYDEHINRAVHFISSNFTTCEDFLEVYYRAGNHIDDFMKELNDRWDGLISAMTESERSVLHISNLLMYLPSNISLRKSEKPQKISEFIGDNLPQILTTKPDLPIRRLIEINVKARSFKEISEHQEICESLFNNGLFDLTYDNIEYVYCNFIGGDRQSIQERNYTSIINSKNKVLIEKVDGDFERYFYNILLKLESNKNESPEALINIMNRDEIPNGELYEFLKTQNNLIPDLNEVPENLRSSIFELSMIEPSWENCILFTLGEEINTRYFMDYLSKNWVINILKNKKIPTDERAKTLRILLIEANELSDEVYQEYIRTLPRNFKLFPVELNEEKISILIEEKKVELNEDTLDYLSNHPRLQTRFAELNIDTFLSDSFSKHVNNEILIGLLNTDIIDKNKLEVLYALDLNDLEDYSEIVGIVGHYLNHFHNEDFSISNSALIYTIKNTESIETKISLILKHHDQLYKNDLIEILSEMPNPFLKINQDFKGYIEIENKPDNVCFSELLRDKKVISTISPKLTKRGKLRLNGFKKNF